MHPRCRPQARAGAASVPLAASADLGAVLANHGNQYPPMDDVFQAHKPTLKRVPKACRGLWTKAVTRAIACVLAFNVAPGMVASAEALQRSNAAWADLLMLPQCVLPTSGRGGKAHKRQYDARVRNKLHRWLDGERMQLWGEDLRNSQGSRAGNNPKARRRRVISLSCEGLDGQACKALVSKGIVAATAHACQTLSNKHPTGPSIPTSQWHVLPAPSELSCEQVLEALKSFPNGSAGGASGWRPQHLVDAAAAPKNGATLEALKDLVNLLVKGHAPKHIAPFLAGATLVALPK